MALIKCPECNKEFSDKAPACPHCGCPLESRAAPEAALNGAAEIPRKSTNRLALLALALLLVSFVGYFVYCKTIKLHPVITLCESVLIDRLKSPSSYKPLKREMVFIDGKYSSGLEAPAWVSIEYEAANSYNAMIKGDCLCFMGALEYKGKIYGIDEKRSLGESPFNILSIVKIVMGDDDVEVPFRAKFKDFRANIFTPPAPGYITGWIGDRGTDYVVNKQLDKVLIEKNRETIHQREIAEKEAEAKRKIAEAKAEEEAEIKRKKTEELIKRGVKDCPKLSKMKRSELVKPISDSHPNLSPNDSSAVVIFFRPQSYFGGNIMYFISENGQNIGALQGGSYFAVQVAPGEHIYTTYPVSPVGEDKIKIQANANETIYIIGSVRGDLKILCSLPELALSTFEKFKEHVSGLAYLELTEKGRLYVDED